jgi:hypothetical protein
MAKTTATIGIRLESTAIVQPGDTLVIAVDQGTTTAEIEEFGARIEERLPGVSVLVVIANSLAVYQHEQHAPSSELVSDTLEATP